MRPNCWWNVYRTSSGSYPWTCYMFPYRASLDLYSGVSDIDIARDSTIWVSFFADPPIMSRSTDLGTTWEDR